MQSRVRILLALAVLCASAFAGAQTPPAAPPRYSSAQLQQIVDRNFGDTYKVAARFTPQYITGDFDGDGAEDIAIVVTNPDPPKGAELAALPYAVIDPYDEYFGYGNPRITTGFISADPTAARFLAIIFGVASSSDPQKPAVAAAWQAAQPKARFLMINLPFDRLATSTVLGKKGVHLTAISADESDIMSALVVWNGKKFRWIPNGIDQ